MHIATIIFSVAILGSLCSCSDSPLSKKLLHAQSIIEEYPDSVRAILDSVDTHRLSRKERALYAVTDAQTRHKLFLPISGTDSLLNLAEDYFDSHGPDSLLMKTLFYRAVTSTEKGEIEEAARGAVNSWEMAKSLDNDYWQAKTAELVADQAMEMQNYQEELKWRKMAADHYKKAGKEKSYLFTLIQISTSYLNLKDSLNAKNLDDSIGGLVLKYPDNDCLKEYHAYYSIFIQNACGHFEKADSLYRSIKGTTMEQGNRAYLDLIRSNILLNQDNMSGCRELLDSIADGCVNSEDRSMLYDQYYRLGKTTGDFDLTTQAADSLLSLQSQLISNALQQPVTATQRDFFQLLAERKEAEKQRKVVILWRSVAISVLVVALIITLSVISNRRKKRKINETVAAFYNASEELRTVSELNKIIEGKLTYLSEENVELERRVSDETKKNEEVEAMIKKQRSELKRKTNKIDKLKNELNVKGGQMIDVYTDQWATINMLCREIADEGKVDSIIVANIRTELEKMKSNSFYNAIAKKLDLYGEGVITKLKDQCKLLSNEDIKLYILSVAGFSITAISLMTGTRSSTIYSRMRRILRLIDKERPADMDLFISLFKRK